MRTRLPRPLGPLALVALAPLAGCGDPGPAWPDRPGPKVVASFPPIACFAVNVAGDDAVVKPAMTGQGPHHFDPKASDAALLRRADVFFLNGLGLDDRIAAKMKGGSGNPGLRLVALGDALDKKLLADAAAHEHAGHAHHGADPHVWLGLDLAEMMVGGIRDELARIDPPHAAGYDRRAAEYVAKLHQLKADGTALLKGKADRKFVTFHESLGYFARAFDLEIADVIEQVPGKEPTGNDLERIVASCLKNKVRVIAVEPQYSGQASAARVLDELRRRGVADAVMVEIDPLETAAEADLTAGWYEAKMRANLDALAKALK